MSDLIGLSMTKLIDRWSCALWDLDSFRPRLENATDPATIVRLEETVRSLERVEQEYRDEVARRIGR